MSIQHTVVHFEIPVIDFKRAQMFYAIFLDSEGNRLALHSEN